MFQYEIPRLFCDKIFRCTLVDITLNQFGLTYYPQFFNHKRYSYSKS